LQKNLSFGDAAAQAAFGERGTLTRVTGGPHVQVSGEYFIWKYVGVAFFGRYAYAPLNENLFRYLQSAAASGASFGQTAKAGNIAGLEFGAGLAVRL
jgi:hypothetical protein